jgi:hypothetical protein
VLLLLLSPQQPPIPLDPELWALVGVNAKKPMDISVNPTTAARIKATFMLRW